jgi:hypothetical protein
MACNRITPADKLKLIRRSHTTFTAALASL